MLAIYDMIKFYQTRSTRKRIIDTLNSQLYVRKIKNNHSQYFKKKAVPRFG